MAQTDIFGKMCNYVRIVIRWSILSAIMGIAGGLMGALFHHALHFVTHVRSEHMWLIFLLPLGGLLTVGLYRILKLRKNRGTNEIIDAILNNDPVKATVAPAIFLATATTHLLGGSAGREGAALQLGGSIGSWIAKWLRLDD